MCLGYSIKLKEHVKIYLKESHLTSVNFDPSNTMVCILNFNCISLSFANENLEKLNWLQISMFNYTLFCEEFDYFTTKIICSILYFSWF